MRRLDAIVGTVPTVVVFRAYPSGQFKGDVIALFPMEAATPSAGECLSYMHIGQHGAADYALVISRTRPARPSEYRDLAAELQRIGYRLKIVQREPRGAFDARRESLKYIGAPAAREGREC